MTGPATIHAIAYTAIAFLLLTLAGNWLCRLMFFFSGLSAVGIQTDAVRAGRLIGPLERLIISFGILAHSWEVLAAVVALKSVARFKELDDKLSAEYFLVGSLFSFVWSVLVCASWVAYDRGPGVRLYDHGAAIFADKKDDRCTAQVQGSCRDRPNEFIIGNLFR